MKPYDLLGLTILASAAVAACASDYDAVADRRRPNAGSRQTGTSAPETPATTYSQPLSGPVPTNSPEGKAFYETSVHPILSQKCGPCHGSAGPGPAWLDTGDPDRSYLQLFTLGYVVENSRIVVKGAHAGVTTNVLTSEESATFDKWVATEIKGGGAMATPNVLAKLGACFDREKFDAMELGQWRTTPRDGEDRNTCTGCNHALCSTCHSADAATGFMNAAANAVYRDQPDYTFEQSKLTTPPYITKYFGVSPDGKAVASGAILKKSVSTQQARPYEHPLFTLTSEQQTALDDFVNDAVTRFNAGHCGQ